MGDGTFAYIPRSIEPSVGINGRSLHCWNMSHYGTIFTHSFVRSFTYIWCMAWHSLVNRVTVPLMAASLAGYHINAMYIIDCNKRLGILMCSGCSRQEATPCNIIVDTLPLPLHAIVTTWMARALMYDNNDNDICWWWLTNSVVLLIIHCIHWVISQHYSIRMNSPLSVKKFLLNQLLISLPLVHHSFITLTYSSTSNAPRSTLLLCFHITNLMLIDWLSWL